MTKKRLIDEDELLDLLNSSNILTALQQGGVDNWEWYEASLENLEELNEEKILEKYPEYKK